MLQERDILNILVVEDNSNAIKELRQHLDRIGHRIMGEAASQKEALRLAEEQWPDLVLMDIFIEGPHDGVECAEALRAMGDVPIVFLTSKTEDEVYQRALRLPHCWFVNKPVMTVHLHRTIDQYLNQYTQKPPASTEAKADENTAILVIRDGYNRIRMPLSDLLYLEGAQGRKLLYYCKPLKEDKPRETRVYQETNSLSNCLRRIAKLEGGEKILKVSRQHAVNLDHCPELADNHLRLSDGTRVTVGPSFIPEVYRHFE